MSEPYFQVDDQVWVVPDDKDHLSDGLALGKVLEVSPARDAEDVALYTIQTPLVLTERWPTFSTCVRLEDEIRKVGEFTGRGPIQVVKYSWMRSRKPSW